MNFPREKTEMFKKQRNEETPRSEILLALLCFAYLVSQVIRERTIWLWRGSRSAQADSLGLLSLSLALSLLSLSLLLFLSLNGA